MWSIFFAAALAESPEDTVASCFAALDAFEAGAPPLPPLPPLPPPAGSLAVCLEPLRASCAGGRVAACRMAAEIEAHPGPVVGGVVGGAIGAGHGDRHRTLHFSEVQATRRVAPVLSPELLALTPVTCRARISVAANGRVERVDVEGCPEPLREPIASAMLQWRFALPNLKGPRYAATFVWPVELPRDAG